MTNIKVVLKPKQGIKVDSSNKYLYDPTLVQRYEDASKEYSEQAMMSEANAKVSEINAEISAERASVSESNAKSSEINAKKDADASAESAYQSQTSALASAEYASNAESDAQNVLETLEHVLISESNARASAEQASKYASDCQEIKNSLLNSDLSNYATKKELNSKQDKLIAGNNIIIENNVISATGGGSGGGSSIIIDAEMSDTSENPVQNKVVKAYIDTTEQDIISGYMDSDSELQIQINAQATAITQNTSDIVDIKNKLDNETGGGSGRNVGDIFYTTRQDSELNGAVECNGGTYNIGDFEGEQSVGNLLNAGSLPYVSLEEYSSIVSTNGSCRAFGWDGGTSFRVPTLKDVYIEAGTATSAGEFINESLPNITGELVEFMHGSGSVSTSGAFETTYKSSAGSSSGSGTSYESTTFDASRVSSTYQDGAKVKPDSVRYRAMIQLANKATDEAVITATSALQQFSNLIPTITYWE